MFFSLIARENRIKSDIFLLVAFQIQDFPGNSLKHFVKNTINIVYSDILKKDVKINPS